MKNWAEDDFYSSRLSFPVISTSSPGEFATLEEALFTLGWFSDKGRWRYGSARIIEPLWYVYVKVKPGFSFYCIIEYGIYAHCWSYYSSYDDPAIQAIQIAWALTEEVRKRIG